MSPQQGQRIELIYIVSKSLYLDVNSNTGIGTITFDTDKGGLS